MLMPIYPPGKSHEEEMTEKACRDFPVKCIRSLLLGSEAFQLRTIISGGCVLLNSTSLRIKFNLNLVFN